MAITGKKHPSATSKNNDMPKESLKSRPAKKEAKKSAAKTNSSQKKEEPRPKEEFWELRLYVAGQTPKSLAAFANLKKICEEHLAGQYKIEVVDLLKTPQLAQGDQILAVPTLVRKLPPPFRRIIGDLSQTERVLVGLDIVEPKK